ncbi:Dynein-1-beta heavy chain, flagellar inner arm I1 complex [Melipona quadrifasciata]|uniref:Dynein-1-beta heavy chain, flagellar inner arm I1 complex n=1 Tax=Melipona quadrifasciata TaxID=166423 RepID=A0A0M8ZYR9_9HYME|nr:Dynein-1-beta heavy chain, flagellar inner arm I1 complex [Melipona quadrifasciata]
MSTKKEQKSEILKKSDKTIDSHREFLDMDTDEEDFGHQESPDADEELVPLEPEKPISIFSEEDLVTLMNYVKDLTIYTHNGISWNKHSDKIIQEYFRNPSYTVLTTFYDKNELNAMLDEHGKKHKLVSRLEKIVWFWIRQIHRATMTLIRRQINNIQDEVDYWNAKHSDLNHLHAQFRNIEVQMIINILKNSHSPSASKLQELFVYIDIGLKEAQSNLMYLNILLHFCKNLNILEDVENSLTEALFLILFIWTESPFYSTKSNMEILCQALSSQIIEQCKKHIKLDIILGNSPEMGIQMLKKCIFCCNIYKTIYEDIMINVISYINPDKKWDISQQEVFSKIDIFKQRCCDVIEISKILIVFGRDTKIGLIGGPNGSEFEAYLREVESLFYESLNEIIMAHDIVFDVTRPIWFLKIKQFRYTVLQLENMVINLINDLFKSIRNIEEGIEAIYALQKFKKRENLRELLQKKWIQIWKIFSNEIEYCYINAINQSKKETSVNINLLCSLQYLKKQHSIITNAVDWIGDCDFEKCVLQQYEHVLGVIDKRSKMFNSYSTNETQ